MSVPDISWKPMDREQLIEYYSKDPKEYGDEEKATVITLVNLVGKGKLQAFQRPDGKIVYQYKNENGDWITQ